LTHGGVANNLRVNIKWIESEELMDDSNYETRLRDFDAILVPGGFGKRGVEGMIRAISKRAARARLTSASVSACRPRASSSRATPAT
jgi:CTP synthase (UTP-ammonia lyase)